MACMQYDAAQIVTYESRNYSEMRSSLAASLATCLQTFARQVRPPHYGTRTAEELPHQRDREWELIPARLIPLSLLANAAPLVPRRQTWRGISACVPLSCMGGG